MKRLSLFLPILSVSLLVFLPASSWSQGGMPSGVRSSENSEIIVQVRNPDGSPASAGIHLRLEGGGGTNFADCITEGSGKCRFVPSGAGRYIIRVHHFGYKDVSVSVELVDILQAYVNLELKPDTGDSRPEIPRDSVSVVDLSVPENARTEFEKGQTALKENKLEASVAHLRKAIKLHASFPQAYTLLGTVYVEQENWDEAEKALQKAISLDGKVSDAYLGLGAVFNQSKQYHKAEAPLLRGLELKPDAPTGHYELAKTYWFLGRWEEAAPHARSAVSAMPEAALPHALLGNILLRERDPQGALDEYQKYLLLDPFGSMAPAVRQVVEKLKEPAHP
jgi:tetratricopeptide (TPR) repeat protein